MINGMSNGMETVISTQIQILMAKNNVLQRYPNQVSVCKGEARPR